MKRPYHKKAYKLLTAFAAVGSCNSLQWSLRRTHVHLNGGATVSSPDAAAASCGSHVLVLR